MHYPMNDASLMGKDNHRSICEVEVKKVWNETDTGRFELFEWVGCDRHYPTDMWRHCIVQLIVTCKASVPRHENEFGTCYHGMRKCHWLWIWNVDLGEIKNVTIEIGYRGQEAIFYLKRRRTIPQLRRYSWLALYCHVLIAKVSCAIQPTACLDMTSTNVLWPLPLTLVIRHRQIFTFHYRTYYSYYWVIFEDLHNSLQWVYIYFACTRICCCILIKLTGYMYLHHRACRHPLFLHKGTFQWCRRILPTIVQPLCSNAHGVVTKSPSVRYSSFSRGPIAVESVLLVPIASSLTKKMTPLCFQNGVWTW
jgi:hypothetical protein